MHACIISLVFIVFNVRDGTESKYPPIVFLSIFAFLISLNASISDGIFIFSFSILLYFESKESINSVILCPSAF